MSIQEDGSDQTGTEGDLVTIERELRAGYPPYELPNGNNPSPLTRQFSQASSPEWTVLPPLRLNFNQLRELHTVFWGLAFEDTKFLVNGDPVRVDYEGNGLDDVHRIMRRLRPAKRRLTITAVRNLKQPMLYVTIELSATSARIGTIDNNTGELDALRDILITLLRTTARDGERAVGGREPYTLFWAPTKWQVLWRHLSDPVRFADLAYKVVPAVTAAVIGFVVGRGS